MAKTEQLDKDSKNRLKKFGEEWEKWDKPSYHRELLAIRDLRLLLENFQPLRDLIRTITAAELPTEFFIQTDDTAVEAPPMAEPLPEDSDELTNTRQVFDQLQAEMADLKKLADHTRDELTKYKIQAENFLREKDGYQQEIKSLRDERKQLHAKLATQAQNSVEPTLAFLRSDPQLAQAMDLADLPTDSTQALIQTVAVLAQFDNLKRLWETLKDRCEAGKRAATDSEHALLLAALSWHNHNWRSLPLRLIDVAVDSRYDYETQSRTRNVTKGETVTAMYLPGIADGSGKTLCKALVQTK